MPRTAATTACNPAEEMSDEERERLDNAAYEAGYEAGITGLSRDINPHHRATEPDLRDAWDAGWEQGHDVRAEIRLES